MLVLGVLGVVALVVLPLLALCEIMSCGSTKSPPGVEHARRLRAPLAEAPPAAVRVGGRLDVDGAEGPGDALRRAALSPGSDAWGGTPPAATDEWATWKARVAGLRADLAKAQKDYDAADRANTVVAFGRPGHDYETLMAIRNATLTPYRLKLEEVQSALAGLTEECRRSAGCQPGWVR